jgi:hypothetical protein
VSEITLETAGNRSENDEKKFQMKNRCGNDFHAESEKTGQSHAQKFQRDIGRKRKRLKICTGKYDAVKCFLMQRHGHSERSGKKLSSMLTYSGRATRPTALS